MRLLLSLLILLQANGLGTDKSIEGTLSKKYEKQLVTLRDFLTGTRLLFDADGKLIGGGEPGVFTLDGSMRVEAVNVDSQKVEIRGRHVFLEYNTMTRKLTEYRTNDQIRMEFSRKPGVSPEAGIDAALLPLERLVGTVPTYWSRYVSGRPDPVPIVDKVTGVVIPRASEQQGLVPKNVHQVTPKYPESLRPYAVTRSVLLRVIVDEQGKPEVADLAEPAGFGLDQAAIEAVNQWQYEPAKADGKPVKVYFRVRVNFNPPR